MPADEGEMAVSTDIQTIQITDSAATKVVELLQRELANAGLAEQAADYALRVQVQPGGCAGLRYALYFDDRKLDGDVVVHDKGVEVRVDRMSAPYLRGSKIDYLDTLQQSGFTIDNPNAKGTCACGDSAQF